ncbi:hypothetical protein [Endozoicomonas numazuensis]|uniref:hypothetical protein n=1 Tax=Endozoicomonas numazuensis TaxID=1137799 RepID=UPI000690846E|nr:hypothetical protein [Endozoicomonas numazuensis]
MTPWVHLLSSTLRLLDLHDSNHERHSENINVSVESRPGLGDGYWLDIACLLLEFLLEEDYRTNGQYIPQVRCLNHLQPQIPELTAEDLAYIANVLSTPSELYFRKRSEQEGAVTASTKGTALLEKQSQIGHIRLSQAGRQSVILSRQVDDILYSEHDAAKIVSAIARSDFDRIPGICDSILLSIRGLTQEVRRIRENPALEGKLESFRNNRKHYEMAARNIQATIMDCQNQFLRPEIHERFYQWAAQQELDWDLSMINQSFSRILNALENLNRRLTDLLRDIAEGRIQSMGVIDFHKAALNLAWTPPSMDLLTSVFAQTAPFGLAVNLPAPGDFQGMLDNQRADNSPRSLVYEDSEEESAESLLLQRFLNLFGQPIRDRLQEGPLSLGEAICNGWHTHHESGQQEDFLPQLINMFVDTEQLQSDLTVAIEYNGLNIQLPDGRRLHGDNPILMTQGSNLSREVHS